MFRPCRLPRPNVWPIRANVCRSRVLFWCETVRSRQPHLKHRAPVLGRPSCPGRGCPRTPDRSGDTRSPDR
eukprot:1328376-Prymnesium_polylepis.2